MCEKVKQNLIVSPAGIRMARKQSLPTSFISEKLISLSKKKLTFNHKSMPNMFVFRSPSDHFHSQFKISQNNLKKQFGNRDTIQITQEMIQAIQVIRVVMSSNK